MNSCNSSWFWLCLCVFVEKCLSWMLKRKKLWQANLFFAISFIHFIIFSIILINEMNEMHCNGDNDKDAFSSHSALKIPYSVLFIIIIIHSFCWRFWCHWHSLLCYLPLTLSYGFVDLFFFCIHSLLYFFCDRW